MFHVVFVAGEKVWSFHSMSVVPAIGHTVLLGGGERRVTKVLWDPLKARSEDRITVYLGELR